MRRRIYVNPEGPLEDKTPSPYLYDLNDEPWDSPGWCDVGALYDEDLWARYEAAREAMNNLEREILQKLRYEPWDDVEVRLATRSIELLNGEGPGRLDEMDRLSEEAVAHARTVEPKETT